MNKKNIFKKTAALALGAALTVAATGCSFVLTDNQKDMAQTIAKVDITKNMPEGDTLTTAIKSILKDLPSEISKRDLIATFLSYGYSQVQNYGYATVFTQILDSLVEREILVQYVVMHYLEQGAKAQSQGAEDCITAEKCTAYKNGVIAKLNKAIAETTNEEVKKNLEDEKALLEKHPEVLTLEYFLTEGGKEMEDYNYTVYSLRKSFNDSIDSLEQEYIKAEEEEHDHATAQTLPTGVTTQKEKYYPTDSKGNLNYGIYTGRNLKVDCGEYETLDGSTTATRRRAYNDFLSNLQSYNLVQSKGGKMENSKEATLLDYYYVELSSALGQALINKYFDELEDTVLSKLDATYAARKYAEKVEEQQLAYEKDSNAFNTAINSESASSITLYGRENFGFVYNILLPFSTEQNEAYARAESRGLTENELFNVRKGILQNVIGKDQRAGWINEHEDENYATYNESTKKWNFFEDILSGKSDIETLEHYLGVVPFNGTATLNKDGKYDYTYEDVTVDDVMTEFATLLNADDMLGKNAVTLGDVEKAYALSDMNANYFKADGKADYSKFVYKKGTIKFGNVNPYDYFNPESNIYKMVSVANELMFAYSTDTGCLNTYMGYAVSPYSTSFVKEFEYAAQMVIKETVASLNDTDTTNDAYTFYAVPTQYGWHIIIPTFVFTGGEVYDAYKHADIEKKGTFSNLFYEYLKTDAVSSYRTDVEVKISNEYNNDTYVTLYKSKYQDLLDM